MNQYQTIIYNIAVEEGVDKINAKLPGFMISQSGHETDEWTSPVFKSCNNGFGYKHVGQKLSQGACNNAPEGGSYAKYASLADSAREMARWIKRREDKFKNVDTLEEYAQALKDNGYYGDSVSNYLAGLKRHYAQVKDVVTTAIHSYPEISIATGVTLFGMLGFYLYKIAKRKK